MRSATSAGNEPALVVNMKKILADSDLVDAMSMELGPAGNYRGKVPVSHMGRLRRKKRLAKCRCSKIMSPLNCNQTLSPYQDGDDESERVPTGESNKEGLSGN